MAAKAFAMPFTNGSMPMKPVRGLASPRAEVLAATETDLEPHGLDRPREQRAQIGR